MSKGTIVQVIGAVVDTEFSRDAMPKVFDALIVDDTDIISKNIAIATDQIKSYNVMPVYGLNVYSMLKHETLVLTTAALERIEERLLFAMHNVNFREISHRTASRRNGTIFP